MDDLGTSAAGATTPVRERAPRILRAVARHFADLGCAVLAEVPLTNGRRADVLALDGRGGIAIVEIKSGVADLAADHKWPAYREFCDRFYFAVDAGFPRARLPEGTGVVVADDFVAEIIAEAPTHLLAPARRKAVTLRFAHLAAARASVGLIEPAGQRS